MQQLELGEEPIETVVIKPTKDMPIDVFKACHRLAYYTELMERIDDNHVVWNKDLVSIYSENAAEGEYYALQNDFFTMDMELPKVFVQNNLMA